MHTDSAPRTRRPKTAAEVRADLNRRGIAVSEWARDHGFSASLVREILTGTRKCHRGQSHQVAVLLGMKDGVITKQRSRTSR